jgi:hypothetical protein
MGEFVDSTLGVTFGLSTLTAAAIGQIFSDVSGVCFGGTVEAFMGKLGIPTASISAEQVGLPANVALPEAAHGEGHFPWYRRRCQSQSSSPPSAQSAGKSCAFGGVPRAPS